MEENDSWRLEDGVLRHVDAPLVRAAAFGRTCVLDEADKAPLEVTCVLRSLFADGTMAKYVPDHGPLDPHTRMIKGLRPLSS